MNAKRRKKIQGICDELDVLMEEEQEAFDNLPESIQYSERGEVFEAAIEVMETAKDGLEAIIDN